MEKETHSSARTLKIAACLLVAAFAQTFLPRTAWLSYIDWLLLVTVYVSLMRDPVQSLLTGTAAGVLQDAASSAPLGISGMANVLAAYLTYWVASHVYIEGLMVRVVTVAGASLVSKLTRLGLYRLFRFDLPPLTNTRSAILWVVIGIGVNLLVSLLLFPALDRIFKTGVRQRARRAEAMRGMRRRRWKKMV